MVWLLAAMFVWGAPAVAGENNRYPRLTSAVGGSVESRVEVPAGFKRLPAEQDSFAAWLRSCEPRHPGVLALQMQQA
jgi:hypothetical protein